MPSTVVQGTVSLKFDSFIQVSQAFGDFAGMARYDEQTGSLKIRLKQGFFWASYAHNFYCLMLELMYFAEAVEKKASFVHFIALCPLMGLSILLITKLTFHKRNEKELNDMLFRLKDIFPETIVPGLQINYARMLWLMKGFSIIYIGMLISFNIFPFVPVIQGYQVSGVLEKTLPFYLKYWYDWRRPVLYELTFLHQLWGSIACVVGHLMADLLYCSTILLISMQFELLNKRLSALDGDEQELISCVKRHLLLVELCDELERIYSPSLLVSFVGSSVIICLSGFQALLGESTSEAFRFSLLLLVFVIQIYKLCYYGTMLTEKSSDVAKHIFQSQWYCSKLSFRKSCLLIMLRGQKEQKMTAFKFTDVSLQSFTTILSSAFSYFTLVKAVYDSESHA